jgi:multiple sugar transport system substrate-binding protein
MEISRRGFLALAGTAASAALLSACTGSSNSGGGGKANTGTLKWWDQFQPISTYEKGLFASFAKEKGGMAVEYTVQNPSTFPRELQLAFQSKQLPDVFTAGVNGLPAATLQAAGWFQPLTIDQAHQDMLPKGTLIEGLNKFDGKVYSIPVLSFRSHDCLTWFNKDLLAKAGLDPSAPPNTYDGIRAAARAIQKTGGNVSGWIAPLNLTSRLSAQITQMAMAAGAPVNNDGVNLHTGEYALNSPEFINALEFWVAMKQDGVLLPSSTTLDARTARARWATGVAGLFLDGSYNVGVIKGSFASFLPKVVVAGIPVPSADTKASVTNTPGNPSLSLWIAKTSAHAEAASALISKFATEEVQIGVAEGMDQPPLRTDVLAKAKVEDVYRKAVDLLSKEVFAGPVPDARNADVAKVNSGRKPVTPDLGTIIAGAVSGNTADWKGALTKLVSDLNTERDRAIKASGTSVTKADWVFSDWQPGKDYETTTK